MRVFLFALALAAVSSVTLAGCIGDDSDSSHTDDSASAE